MDEEPMSFEEAERRMQKVRELMKKLHPEGEEVSTSQSSIESSIIERFLDEIEKYFQEVRSDEQYKEMTDQEIMQNALNMAKVLDYTTKLYPDGDCPEYERKIIEDHIDEIDEYFWKCLDPRSGAQQDGLSNQEIVRLAIRYVEEEQKRTSTETISAGEIERVDTGLKLEGINGHKEISASKDESVIGDE